MKEIGGIRIRVIQGDITDLEVDAIVNAANSDLWMGSGVAGAIKRRGGEEIEKEAMAQGPIRPGEAVATTAGRLPAKRVIHCAGMPPGGRARTEYVRSSVKMALELAAAEGLSTVAFPAIGAGVGGLGTDESTRAILEGVAAASRTVSNVREVILVGYSDRAFNEIRTAVEQWEATG